MCDDAACMRPPALHCTAPQAHEHAHELYPDTPEWCLSWPRRVAWMVEHVRSHMPDVLCLQVSTSASGAPSGRCVWPPPPPLWIPPLHPPAHAPPAPPAALHVASNASAGSGSMGPHGRLI